MKPYIKKAKEYLTNRNIENYNDLDEVIIVVNDLHLTLSKGECINLSILQLESEIEYMKSL